MASNKVQKYGCNWPVDPDDRPEDTALKIEMACIQRGVGNGLPFHYEQMRKMLWPRLDDHRWHRLIRDTILSQKCTILAGCASSAKSHEAAWITLCEYFVYPQETCILVCSTELRGLRGRIWSEITQLWQEARDRFDWLSGNLLDSRVAILTDSLAEDEYDKRARNYRKCIQGVPCREDGAWVGINRYMGWKQKRMRLVADELNQLSSEFIIGITNLNANPDFKFIGMGNFNDTMDCLGKCAEPKDGWPAHMEPLKTEVWDTIYPLPGKCINLIGFDSPNFDPDTKEKYPYLIGPRHIGEIEKSFGRQSLEFMSQCWGAMKVSQLSSRVLTRQLCQENGAFEETDWQSPHRTKVAFLDSAWGGDRCVFTWAEFGLEVGGKTVFHVHPPEIVPVKQTEDREADYIISEWCKQRCETLDIPPENFGHDSTGRGSLGTALARVWSAQCNPIEFGQQPTNRPVSQEYWWVHPKTKKRQIKLCSEHYSKFVTELWFSVRYCVESGQLRNLSREVMEEFSLRLWYRVKDDKIEVEPKSGSKEKPGMKQRTGKSPDYADSLSGTLEMARRKGFTISKLANEETEQRNLDWLLEERRKYREHRHRSELVDA